MKTTSALKKEQAKKESSDTLLNPRQDRRLLANVPDESGERSNADRRGSTYAGSASFDEFILKSKAGIRYQADIRVLAKCRLSYGRNKTLKIQGVDISSTGMLLRLSGEAQLEALCKAQVIQLKFRIKAGTMPEGYEMQVKIGAKVVRAFTDEEGVYYCGVEFEADLSRYAVDHKDKHALAVSSLFLFFIVAFII
ncbi:MAG TPA: PilZ domain-containing protein, partial [Clostridia bacterium]|nr:PilZ domain-containing protein [Clostridia bacterium]